MSFNPADGWFSSPADTTPGQATTVVKQGTRFTVQANEWGDSPAAEVERVRRSIVADRSVRRIGDGTSFSTAAGLNGTQLSFVADHAQGRAWVSVDEKTKTALVVIAVSPIETYQQITPEVDTMLDSVRETGAAS